MCDFGVGEYAAMAAMAAGATATYVGQEQSNAAMQNAAQQSIQAQKQAQLKQMQYIDNQDTDVQKSRDVFQQQVLPEISAQKQQADEATQTERLRGIFDAASTAAAANADPTRTPDAVSTVGAPTDGGKDSAGSKAYDASLAANLARAISFNTQQDGALAGISGRTAAAGDQARALQRTGEQIGQNNDAIAGLSRLANSQGRVIDATEAAGQANVGKASHKGDDWKTTGTVLSALGSILSMGSGGWGSLLSSGAETAGAAGAGAGASGASMSSAYGGMSQSPYAFTAII